MSFQATNPKMIRVAIPANQPNRGIIPKRGTRASHPAYFLFSKILHLEIKVNIPIAVQPAIGTNHKNTNAQWNFPSSKTIAVLANGIHASQGRLCFSFLPILIQANEVYTQSPAIIMKERISAPAISAPILPPKIAVCIVSFKVIF